jgi:hypothetical protein
MSLHKFMRPGALVMMAGLLPLASAQAHAQSASATSLLSTSVMTLPSDSTKDKNDTNFDLMSDFTLGQTDPIGTQDIAALSHSGSGISSGWLIGGGLGAAAGLLGLASGGGSFGAIQLRTPAGIPDTIASASLGGNSAVLVSLYIPSNTSTGVSVVNNAGSIGTLTQAAGSPDGRTSGTVKAFASVTPEPGTLALLSGMGLMLTAAKMRRRKR